MGLVAFVMFLALPIALVIEIGNMEHYGYTLYESQKEFKMFMLYSELILLLVMCSGFLIAIYQFRYLHSKRMVDFYHSFPLKKEQLYRMYARNAYVDFVIPYTAAILISLMIGLARGLATWEAIGVYFLVWFLYQVVFLLCYGVAVVAMLLTGREFVGILTIVLLLFLPVAAASLINWYQAEFFHTYTGYYVAKDWYLYISPGCIPWSVRNELMNFVGERGSFHIDIVIFTIMLVIFAIAFMMTGFYLMKKRPSEAAGNSVVFSVPARLCHVILSIIGALFMGMFVYGLANYNSIMWLMAGVVLGGLVLYALIQFIYTIDFRKVFQHKWQFLVVEAASLLIAGLFCFDWIGYDSYIPKQMELSSVAISIPDRYHYEMHYTDGAFVNAEEYRLEHMNLMVTDQIYKMLEETVRKNIHLNDDQPRDGDVCSVQVRYKLKNGSTHDRSYLMNVYAYEDEFIRLYDQAEFKNSMIPMYELFTDESKYEICLEYENETIPLFGNDQKKAVEFIQVLKQDFEQRKGNTFVKELPIAILQVQCETLRQGYDLFIYPSSTSVIKYLEESGYALESSLTVENILKIEIMDNRIRNKKEESGMLEETEVVIETKEIQAIQDVKAEYPDENVTIYTKAEDIEQILPALVDYKYESLWAKTCQDINVTVTYTGKDGYQVQSGYALLEDKLPAFLR